MISKKIALISFFLLAGFATYRYSFGLFTSASSNNGNNFIASDTFPTKTPTPTPQLANHVVISEIQLHGANANQDFVELYNPKNTTEDLSGWQLRIKNSAGTDSSLVLIPSGKSIPAHGFFLWSNDQGTYETDIGADVSNGNNISENNSLELEDASDNTVDMVGWGNVVGHYVEGTPYPASPGTGQSIERRAYSSSTTTSMSTGGTDVNKGNAFDSGDNSNDFITRTSQPQNTISPTETP